MKALTTFDFEGHVIQVIIHKGEPWFIGKETCDALGFGNHRQAMAVLSPHQRDYVQIMDAIGRLRDTSIISEGGLYKLAFHSRKPEAERFTNKVVDEVLPAIRKTGKYDPSKQVADQLETFRVQMTQKATGIEAIIKDVFERSRHNQQMDDPQFALIEVNISRLSTAISDWQSMLASAKKKTPGLDIRENTVQMKRLEEAINRLSRLMAYDIELNEESMDLYFEYKLYAEQLNTQQQPLQIEAPQQEEDNGEE